MNTTAKYRFLLIPPFRLPTETGYGYQTIANTLAQQGKKSGAGMVVITGSIIATEFLSGGDAAVFEVERLGRAALTLR